MDEIDDLGLLRGTVWETNRGCPFSCTYCDWGSATASKVSRMDMDKLGKELLWFAKNKVEFILSYSFASF